MRMQKKPSKTQSIFTNFASSRFLNRDQVMRQLQATVEELRSHRRDVERIYLFGSFASGVPTPRSDLDLIIVSEASSEDFLPYFLSLPIPVDIHVLKPQAFKNTARGIVREAVEKGIPLL